MPTEARPGTGEPTDRRGEGGQQVAEWIKITERISRQVDGKMERGRPEGGISAAARELGVEESDAHRAVSVASISEEAKEAARDGCGPAGRPSFLF